jgi:WD repeat-containing protein 59
MIGELVCFWRAPGRMGRVFGNPLQGLSPTKPSRVAEPVARIFQSPALISDAVRRLGMASTDRSLKLLERRPDDGSGVLRTMTNLLTYSDKKSHADQGSKPPESSVPSYSLVTLLQSQLYIMGTGDVPLYDRRVAAEYVFDCDLITDTCETNAAIARQHCRFDHERMFKTLRSLVPRLSCNDGGVKNLFTYNDLAHQVVTRL